MKLETLKLTDIVPYKKNPRKNDGAVNAVAESIKQCTYITPIIVDEEYVIIVSHGDLLSIWNAMYIGLPVESYKKNDT